MKSIRYVSIAKSESIYIFSVSLRSMFKYFGTIVDPLAQSHGLFVCRFSCCIHVQVVLWNLLLTLFPAIRMELNASTVLVLYNTKKHGYFMLREKGITSSFCNFLFLCARRPVPREIYFIPGTQSKNNRRLEVRILLLFCLLHDMRRGKALCLQG